MAGPSRYPDWEQAALVCEAGGRRPLVHACSVERCEGHLSLGCCDASEALRGPRAATGDWVLPERSHVEQPSLWPHGLSAQAQRCPWNPGPGVS